MQDPRYIRGEKVYIIENREIELVTINSFRKSIIDEQKWVYEIIKPSKPLDLHILMDGEDIYPSYKEAYKKIMPEWEKKLVEKYKSLPDGKVYIVKVNETVSFQTDREGMIEHVIEIERGNLALNEALLQEAREHFPNPENEH